MTRLEAPPSVNYVEQWIRVPEVGLVAASATSGEKVEAYKGFRSVSALSVTVEGPGSWAKGRIKGRIETYEWEKIYQVYNLPKSESVNRPGFHRGPDAYTSATISASFWR